MSEEATTEQSIREGWRRDAVAGGKLVTYCLTGNALLCSHTVYRAVDFGYADGMHVTHFHYGVPHETLILPTTIKTHDAIERRYLLLHRDSRNGPNAEWGVEPHRYRSLKGMPGAFRDPYMSRAEYKCIMAVMDDYFCSGRPLPDRDAFLALLSDVWYTAYR